MHQPILPITPKDALTIHRWRERQMRQKPRKSTEPNDNDPPSKLEGVAALTINYGPSRADQVDIYV